MKSFFCALFLLATVLTPCSSFGAIDVPAYRTAHPETRFLGPDVLWRPREMLVFHLMDKEGTGFKLSFTVRDMNTYVHAPAPVTFWVVGPDDQIVARSMMDDDGITGGNFDHQDGIYDPFADFRYRQYHRANSPNGSPPDKTRSPYLEHPEQLPARTLSLTVPASGKGLYRVAIVGRWDHWISVTPDRPMAAGIHPGEGPLYLHGNALKTSYLYSQPDDGDLGLMVTEEILPYNWQLQLSDNKGTSLAKATASGFATFLRVPNVPGNSVYKLELSGSTTGACLHGKGLPLLLCPDAATAETLRGGIRSSHGGTPGFFAYFDTLDAWKKSLTADSLEVNIELTDDQKSIPLDIKISHAHFKTTLGDVAEVLKQQSIDPEDKAFGKLEPRYKKTDTSLMLALAAGLVDAGNPYHGNPAIIPRPKGLSRKLSKPMPIRVSIASCSQPLNITAFIPSNAVTVASFWSPITPLPNVSLPFQKKA